MENNKNLCIKHLADEDKPREKLIQLGKKSLTNAELLAILLHNGTPGQNVVELAKQILHDAHNNLGELTKFELNDLKRYNGMGDAKSITVMAAMELGIRLLNEGKDSRETIITASEDVFNYLAPKLCDNYDEEFWAIYLNNRNKIVATECIAKGGITSTYVDIRKLFKYAFLNNATCMAVAHNHPSGKLTPSNEDKILTRKIQEAGKILNIKLLDHLIIGILPSGKIDYYSFLDNDVF